MSVRIIHGDCRLILPTLPADSFDCVVTSPPYFGLRDYGVEGQIGLEPTLALYLETMVGVGRELRRVLKPSGTFWLNVGDSYNAHPGQRKTTDKVGAKQLTNAGSNTAPSRHTPDLKPKDLMMVPNRLAILLQDDGWYVRSEIIWHKPSPMPESVTDRPTCAHEKVWLLTKSAKYYYDAEAIAESSCAEGRPQRARAKQLAADAGLTDAHIAALKACGVSDVGKAQATQSGFERNTAEVMRLAKEAKAVLGGYTREFLIAETINARNVWSIASEPYRGAHYAVMPSSLAERCIKAGCPMGGSVFDPFGGAGTTGLVADRLGRDATLIELNPANRELGAERVRMDGPLFAEVSA